MAEKNENLLNDAELEQVRGGDVTQSGATSYVCPDCLGTVKSGHVKLEGMIYFYWECTRCGNRVLVDTPDSVKGLRPLTLRGPEATTQA